MKPDPPRDEKYWATHDLKDWKGGCFQGIPYASSGWAPPAGTKGVVRKISTGRKKHRGMASDPPKFGWVDGLP
jgi:hypothetical protein